MATEVIVAAIDFGTTFSGYAYSWKHDYEKDPLKAEEKYSELTQTEEHTGWRYFRRFKMELNRDGKLSRRLKIKDDQGTEMQAKQIFGESIKYLKNHLLENLKTKNDDMKEKDISWVLTVPAIWQDGAKQFMTEAAEYARIDSSRLTLALEPEAAAVYCKELNVKKKEEGGSDATLETFKEGAKFMIVDLGGGTVDCTVHEVQPGGSLGEITPPSGGPWGGTLVDESFTSFLNEICTETAMNEFQQHFRSDHLDLFNKFEIKKREDQRSKGLISITIPSVLPDIVSEQHSTTLETKITESKFSKTVSKKRDKIIIEQKVFISFFEEAKTQLVSHLCQLLSNPNLKEVTTLIMVGGFSEAKVMSCAVREAFRHCQVIVPEEAGLAVVKGAVLIGRNPSAIASRKMRCTYGISTSVPFDPSKHSASHQVMKRDGPRCEDVFLVFARKGTDAIPGESSVEHIVNCDASQATIEIYRSSEKSPKYVTDKDSSLIGNIEFHIANERSYEKTQVKVKMVFGLTQLKVVAEEVRTKNYVSANFNLLGPR